LIGYVLPFILTILFLFLAFKNIDLRQSFDIILHSSISAIILYIVVFFISHLARALRWKFMTNSIKKDISYFHLFGSVMVSYGVSCVVPRLGELYRGLFLGRWEGVSRSAVVGTIVVERIIDIAMFLVAALVCVAIYSGDILTEITWLKPSIIVGIVLLSTATVLMVILVLFKKTFSNWINKVTGQSRNKLSGRLITTFETLVSGLNSIKGTKNILAVSIWSVVIILLYALNSYVGFYMIGFHSKAEVSFQMAFILMTISSFGVMIPTPGGVGPYHMISIFVLTQLYGFDYEGSAAYSILTNFVSYICFMFSTLVIVYVVNKQRERRGLSKETFFSVFKVNPTDK
jgi:glycosyltransferase 2 family protein